MDVNKPEIDTPSDCIAMIAVIEISAAIKVYSIAVAPDSSRQRLRTQSIIVITLPKPTWMFLKLNNAKNLYQVLFIIKCFLLIIYNRNIIKIFEYLSKILAKPNFWAIRCCID